MVQPCSRSYDRSQENTSLDETDTLKRNYIFFLSPRKLNLPLVNLHANLSVHTTDSSTCMKAA